ncbi:hypothetical protein BT96DRAFT_220693 [Gymnopus androsaceus JB14]|uniref:Uncharacterized protein n=1 Tax=Gymnopus androsaceus JB14 TaxID=1447944 RepID=A0A6A4I741_9AGAR|nr:hypothetical protein BT96DRAFT_220693 [Gymnopus androsaceus JB14]
MAHYPFRHSTYYTRDDVEFISELPPMNSEEDLMQELQTYGRDISSPVTTARRSSFTCTHGAEDEVQRKLADDEEYISSEVPKISGWLCLELARI